MKCSTVICDGCQEPIGNPHAPRALWPTARIGRVDLAFITRANEQRSLDLCDACLGRAVEAIDPTGKLRETMRREAGDAAYPGSVTRPDAW